MRSKKNIVPVAHKRVMSTIEKYKERVKTDKDLYNEDVENFIINVAPLLTKKGTVNKRKINQFNELVTGFKSQGLDTLIGIKRENARIKKEKSNKKREEKLAKRWVNTREDAEEVTKLLENKLAVKLMNKGYLDIYNLMDIAEDDEIEEVDTKAVIDYALKELESVAPDEILDLLEEDDDIQLFTEYTNAPKKVRENFMTRSIFNDWLQDNFERVKKRRFFYNYNINSYDDLTDVELEFLYKDYLKGGFNRYL